VYENFVNEAFNARQPWNHLKNKDRQNDYGFSIGGPVRIPKVYNGTNRTFFFFNLERFRNNQQSVGTSSMPTAAYRQGDLSCALYVTQTNCTGPMVTLTDPATGYQYLQNQVFDPASTHLDPNNRLIRNAFPNNIIPRDQMDPVSLKLQAMLPAATGTQITNNWAPVFITKTRQDIPSIKIDQNFGSATKLSFYFNRSTTNTPAFADGLPLPLSGIRKVEGGLVGGNQYRVNIDRTLSSSLLAHLGVGYWRFLNPDSSPASSLNYDVIKNLGLVGSSTGVGFPRIGGYGYSTLGVQTSTFQETGIASAVGSLMWTHGTHTYKVGFEIKDSVYSSQVNDGVTGNYNFSSAQTGQPYLGTSTTGTGTVTGGIGMAYASFLLGQVQNYSVSPPKASQQRSVQTGVYVMDSFKVTPRLTLEIGARWDRTPPGHETWDRQSQISLSTPNPNADGLLGATVFAGYGPGRCNCEFVGTYNFAVAPRLAIAYQIDDKTVLRAGWGFSYGSTNQWNYLSNNYLINGMGYTTLSPGNDPQFGYAYSRFRDGIVYNLSDLYKVNLDPAINSPKGAIGNPSASAIAYDPTGARPPRVNSWNVGLQRQLTKDVIIEANYVGNRGVWEQTSGMVRQNAITPARFKALGIDLNNAAHRTLLTQQTCSATAIAFGIKLPYAGFPCTATVAQALRPYPMFGTINPQFANQGNSYYDSLQAKFTKRLSHGLDITSAYTFSKTLNIGGYINGNPDNRSIQKGLDASHFPHISVTAITYQSPKLTSNKLVRAVVGNWTSSAALRYASGSMISAPGSQLSRYDTYSFAAGTMMMRTGQPLFLTDINCRCIDPNNINQRILNPAAWADVAPGSISPGSGLYNDYRGPHQVSENVSLGRTFRIREGITLNVRSEFFNIFNRVTLGTPSSGNPTTTTSVNNVTGAINGFGYYNVGSTSNAGGQRLGLMVARLRF